jgi:two-component system phosphate regulon sensor histidine kinase PhoR
VRIGVSKREQDALIEPLLKELSDCMTSMDNDPGGQPQTDGGRLDRIRRNLPLLLTAAFLLLVLDLMSGGRGWLATVSILVLLAVSVLFPPSVEQPANLTAVRSEGKGLEALSAIHLAAGAEDPIYILDGEGVVLYLNDAARVAFGALSAGISIQLKFRAPEMQAFLDEALKGRRRTAVEYLERVPIERVYRVSSRPIGDNTNLFIILFRDQSEARRIDRMRADFIANASHELRTPLASISGFIETLRGPAKNDPKAHDQFLQIMHTQTRRMARLIDDLLSLSRIEVKPYSKPDELVDLRPLLAGVRNTLAQIAEESGVSVELNVPDEPLEVAGFRDELVQVFENLMSNACKYGRDGKRVIVSVAEENGEKTVTITDFGQGIPEEHLPRLTERFYRVDTVASHNAQGTGLGLAIVKHILNRHGARLTIRSKPGEGASFTVHFPSPEA